MSWFKQALKDRRTESCKVQQTSDCGGARRGTTFYAECYESGSKFAYWQGPISASEFQYQHPSIKGTLACDGRTDKRAAAALAAQSAAGDAAFERSQKKWREDNAYLQKQRAIAAAKYKLEFAAENAQLVTALTGAASKLPDPKSKWTCAFKAPKKLCSKPLHCFVPAPPSKWGVFARKELASVDGCFSANARTVASEASLATFTDS